jgi:hypothetical protein
MKHIESFSSIPFTVKPGLPQPDPIRFAKFSSPHTVDELLLQARGSPAGTSKPGKSEGQKSWKAGIPSFF